MKGSQKSQVDADGTGGGRGGGGGRMAEEGVVEVVVQDMGLNGGGGLGGRGGGEGFDGSGWWCWWWRLVSAVANWRRAEPVLRRDLMYMLWAAEKACLAFTNCFMYLFLALHLDTISSLSNLEYQQPIFTL